MDPEGDVNLLSDFITETYQNLINELFPLRTFENIKKPPVSWFSPSLHNMRETLSSVKIIADSSNDPVDILAYKTLKKSHNIQLKRSAYDEFLLHQIINPKIPGN
ncbi:hypothetical protein JTB14_021016 [Gonioctena quinquepunctata]|nr:hypothetical protein JTB14_021016 [Gonioctena quinquepunctata]